MRARFVVLLSVAVLVLGVASTAQAANPSEPQTINDDQLSAQTTTQGGAKVLPTSRTIPHWHGSTTDPNNGVTYGYNMVGADPNTCSGSACDVTVQVDITPIIVNVGGMTFDGRNVVQGVLHSPEFATNDYSTTSHATIASCTYNNGFGLVNGSFCEGPGGALSQLDPDHSLQLQDATMRAQFNTYGTYHLRLQPNVLPAVTINVPANQGTLLQSGRGVIFGDVDYGWWSGQIMNLETKADPTHLPLYLTDSVLLYLGNDPGNCCVIGYHGTGAAGDKKGYGQSQGNAPIQTFAWASWVRPGIYARPNGGTDWALQDIHALSHEIAEWADDPFVNNTVEPWLTPTAPQYGCTSVLETGDPVVGIGFSMGTNTYDQTVSPNGTSSFDGTYHPEDEVFMPWFLRLAPNNVSEPTQSPSTNVGRYTLMGDLNPFPGFRQPATGC
jgi:hypothetical protein